MKMTTLTASLAAMLLSACASVDQYGSRVYDGNINSQDASNQELLLNIVRASRFQALNFIAISQVTGGQTETLTTGLPTISFGPHAMAPAGVGQISNSLSSAVNGGYQSNPLQTTAFQSGMLAPVDPRTIALLIASHPREIVYFALLDSITVTQTSANGAKTVARLYNDPTNNRTDPLDPTPTTAACRQEVENSRSLGSGARCSYAKFSVLLNELEADGLSAEILPQAPTPATPAQPGSTGATSTTTAPGRICFEPSAAFRLESKVAATFKSLLCGTQAKPDQTQTLTTTIKTKTGDTEKTTMSALSAAPLGGTKKASIDFYSTVYGRLSLTLQLRSPFQLFNYLGAWERGQSTLEFPGYNTLSARLIKPDAEPYLNITNGSGVGCYTSIVYGGLSYCVPANSYHTALLLDLLQNLRNLAISPADLNSAFTVRLSQ